MRSVRYSIRKILVIAAIEVVIIVIWENLTFVKRLTVLLENISTPIPIPYMFIVWIVLATINSYIAQSAPHQTPALLVTLTINSYTLI